MRKIKYAFILLAAALTAVSCTEESENENPGLGEASAAGHLIINAVAGRLGTPEGDTRAVGAYGYEVVWDEADQIAVIDGTAHQGLFDLIDGVGETLGQFQQSTGTTLSGEVTGYYPATLLQADGTLSWPAGQTYSKQFTGIPMTASATVAGESGTNFSFKNLGGVLQLVLTSEEGDLPMRHITVSAANAGMSGAFTVADGAATGFTAGSTITLDCEGLVIGTAAKPVNIAIPAGNYTDMQLTFVTKDGRTRTLTSSALSIKRSVVTKVTLALNGFSRLYPDYLKFTAVGGDVAAGLQKAGTPDAITFEYTSDPVSNEWTEFTADNTVDGVQVITTLAEGETVFLRAKSLKKVWNNHTLHYWSFNFSGTGKVRAGGNILSLLDPDVQSLEVGSYAFFSLFGGCASLLNTPSLPATKLGSYCYDSMFRDCTSLTEAPELPAKALNNYCYYNMFTGCTALKQAPDLPAKTLAAHCYEQMFYGCTSLTQAPELPAMNLARYCYCGMFEKCGSLTQAPELPATTVSYYCYSNMFYGCTSLTQAPALPATTLAESCYYYMFQDCTSLTQAPALPATTLAKCCYYGMFQHCSALTQAPELLAPMLVQGCYVCMFRQCTSLRSLTVAFTDWIYGASRVQMLPDGTISWLDGVASTGVFYCPRELDTSSRDVHLIPEGWEVRYTSLSSDPVVGEKYSDGGIEAMYVGVSGGKKLIVATQNYGATSIYDKGTAFTRNGVARLDIPAGWQLPTAADMAFLAGLGFTDDPTHDGAYNSTYDYYIPYTQDVSGGLREGRLWVSGGTDNDFYWFRSDDRYGLTTTATANPNYYVRLVKHL